MVRWLFFRFQKAVAVAASPDEVAHFQAALLGQHMGQQRVAGDVEGYAQEDVGAALVELAAELSFSHIELEEGVAGHEGHLVQLGHVPGADDDAAAVGIALELLDDFGNLVDMRAVGLGPAAPLHAIHRAQVAGLLVGPFVPDGAAALLQPLHIAVAAQKPQQLQDDGLQVHLLGGDQGEAFIEVEAHLVAEHTARSRARAVGFGRAVLEHMAHKGFVLAAHGAQGAGAGVHGAKSGQRLAKTGCAGSVHKVPLLLKRVGPQGRDSPSVPRAGACRAACSQ